eukprot:TRINITY_DN1962_c0_g2_i1.p1 TRINITY_DN1962_c0_g2~~TRINITY_DN1962_c0_g2_i1.p1  ORF type:complete len:205 (+),score=33.47 TRINITY_DN1962_c0_g2_i1:138-752(+)
MEDYKKVKVIGMGSFSKVYKVVQRSTGEEFAMKVIDTTKKRKEELKNEVALVKKLNSLANPNIIKYQANIVMEYCSGGSLEDLIEKHKEKHKHFSEARIVEFMRQILTGVDCVHKSHILHRDLKPANILIDGKGNLKYWTLGYLGSCLTRETMQILPGGPCGTQVWKSSKAKSTPLSHFSLGAMLRQMIGAEYGSTINCLRSRI